MLEFLPVNQEEMLSRGWDQVDFVYVSGDSYVDHPSFGMAIITRLLEKLGFKIGVLAQPNWQDLNSFKEFNEPKYGFIVSSGNVDSMVNHYSVAKKIRKTDFYTAGGVMGKRPDYAVRTYSNQIRKAYPESNILLGGVEASLRRFAHYDYWADTVLPSVLVESKADMLMYGMGENVVTEVVTRLRNGESLSDIKDVKGTCYIEKDVNNLQDDFDSCSSFAKVAENKLSYAKATKIQIENQDYAYGKVITQKHGDVYLVQNKPQKPLTTEEMDDVYAMEYKKTYHPMYEKLGGVPSITEVEFSLVQNRGCFGNCNFCAIALHQGKYVSSRSKESLVKEATDMVKNPNFKGYIHDVGGPTANFRKPSCDNQLEKGICKHRKCLSPKPCKNLKVDHNEYIEILREIRSIEGIKKVFIRSGIRFDYVMYDRDDKFLKEVVKYHVSGQLKVAPEHISDNVLKYIGKPSVKVYQEFSDKFYSITKSINKKQYLVPYLMSSHPGSTLQDAILLTLYLKRNKVKPEQVQDFYPTPATVSTCMFYSGYDPLTMEKVETTKDPHEKALQRALLQYYKENNQHLVVEALTKAGRTDLIGTHSEALVKPLKGQSKKKNKEIEIRFNGDDRWQKGNKKGTTKRKTSKRR